MSKEYRNYIEMRHRLAINVISEKINNIQDRIAEIEEGKFDDRFEKKRIEKYKQQLENDEISLSHSLKTLINIKLEESS